METATKIIIKVCNTYGQEHGVEVITSQCDCNIADMHLLWIQALMGAGFQSESVKEFYSEEYDV